MVVTERAVWVLISLIERVISKKNSKGSEKKERKRETQSTERTKKKDETK